MFKKLLFSCLLVLPLLAQAQFLESFEGAEAIPTGWTVIDGGDANNTWSVIDLSGSEITAQTGTNIAFIIYGADAHDDYLITPQITVTDGVSDYLTFYARSRDPNYPETISLELSTTGNTAADFSVVLDANVAPASGADFFKYQYDLSAYEGQSIYIGFHSTTTDMFAFDIDDVEITAVPTCFEPSNPVVDAVTTSTADLSWTGDVANYQVEYGGPGFTPGSGALSTVTGATSTMLTGLSDSTTYEYYVRQDCGSSDYSNWVGPVSFSTTCVSTTAFPVEEGFESGTIPVCWSNEIVSGTTEWTYVATNGDGSITPRTGSVMAEFRNSTSGTATKLVTEPLDLSSASDPELEFFYANVNWVGDIDELRVYYKTSEAGAWTQIGTDYTDEQTAWTNVTLTLPNPSATYYIAFEGTSNWARGLNIDDVSVRLMPLSVDTFNKAELTYYPNPVKNSLHISHTAPITSVEIFDLLGKKVLQYDKKGNSIEIDMNSLAAGSYIAKVYGEDSMQTIKVVKD